MRILPLWAVRRLTSWSCWLARRQVASYLDRELTAPQAAAVDEHLQLCPPCRQQTEVSQDISLLVRHCVAHDAVPPDLRARVVRRCANPTTPPDPDLQI